MWKSASLVLIFLCLNGAQGFRNSKSYEGYTVYRVILRNEADANFILGMKKISGINFWSNIDLQKHRVDIMVAPEIREYFLRTLKRRNIRSMVLIGDVEIVSELFGQRSDGLSYDHGTRNISRYMSYQQMKNYAQSIANVTNPLTDENLVQLEIIGKSYSGQDVIMIKISSDHKKGKPIILMDAAMHAREWAGPPTVLYLVQQLVENYRENMEMLKNMDFYIIPVTNPDGYEYSRNHDRFWRKTRSDQGKCIGADGNRNFDFFWGLTGTSSNSCTDIYKGPEPFSEVESRNIRDIAIKYQDRLLGYIAVHSYGGYLLYPWGYSRELPADWASLDECASKFAKSIEQYSGTKYLHGTSARILYEASGGSDDWMKGKLDVPFTYTLEIQSPESEGFHLNPRKLPSVGEETFVGFKALAKCFWELTTSRTAARTRMVYMSDWKTN